MLCGHDCTESDGEEGTEEEVVVADSGQDCEIFGAVELNNGDSDGGERSEKEPKGRLEVQVDMGITVEAGSESNGSSARKLAEQPAEKHNRRYRGENICVLLNEVWSLVLASSPSSNRVLMRSSYRHIRHFTRWCWLTRATVT